MPAFNYERAAAAIVDAAYMGDKEAAQKHGVTTRTIRRWRKRLETDAYFESLVSDKMCDTEISPLRHSTKKIKLSRKNNRPRFVYLIKATNGLIKIGIAKDVAQRLRTLDNMSPVPLDLLHVIETKNARELEGELHERFALKRIRGEWFSLTTADMLWVLNLHSGNNRKR